MGRNVTTRRAGAWPVFTVTSTRSTILPGDGDYRYYLNAGIMSIEEGIVMGAGRGSVTGHTHGNRR